MAHPHLLCFSPSPFGTEEELKEYWEAAISCRENGQRYAFVIFDKQHQRYAGSTSYGNISLKDKRLKSAGPG